MSDEDDYDAEDDEIKAQRKILELLEKDDDAGVAIEYNSGGEDGEKPANRNAGMNGKINGGATIDEEDEDMMGDDY